MDSETILVVDDNPNNLAVLENILNVEGYAVRAANSGEVALKAVAARKPDLILLDVMMPGLNGFEVCHRLKADPGTASIPVLFISAMSETDEKIKAFEAGGQDYITKPFAEQEVLARVGTHLRLYRMERSLQAEVVAAVEEQAATLTNTIAALSRAIEKRDPYTDGHQKRVARLAAAIATDLGLLSEEIRAIQLAALIHDIGKLSVPVEILVMPRKLNRQEFDLVKLHSSNGREILQGLKFPYPLADIIAQHHEVLDGSGYPDGLQGDQILLAARVLTVSDFVEAVSAHRPYRPSLGVDFALEQINKGKGVLYDPAVVDSCTAIINRHGIGLLE